MKQADFIFGVDLDGVCADFYAAIRQIAAEWLDVPLDQLSPNVSFGFEEWNLEPYGGYDKLHRFAVVQRNLFKNVQPIQYAAKILRQLSKTGIRIRIVTNRLFLKHFHQTAIQQTIEWLDYHDMPYWDLCFLKDKTAVGANIYIDDSPINIQSLRDQNETVIIFDNSTNQNLPGLRARDWLEVNKIVQQAFGAWQKSQ